MIETNGVPTYDIMGNYTGYRGFDRDITGRRRMEEALRTSWIRLSESMELAHIVYWEFDPATQVYVFNDSFYDFYGTTVEREGGYRLAMEDYAKRFIPPDDLHVFYQCVDRNIARSEPEFIDDIEHRIIRRDGQVRHVLVRSRAINNNRGDLVRLYGATQDITERKKAEDERETLIMELREALLQVKTLTGLLPICSYCKKIRNDQGNWEMMETYIRDRSGADFSHSICPECAQRMFPEHYKGNRRVLPGAFPCFSQPMAFMANNHVPDCIKKVFGVYPLI